LLILVVVVGLFGVFFGALVFSLLFCDSRNTFIIFGHVRHLATIALGLGKLSLQHHGLTLALSLWHPFLALADKSALAGNTTATCSIRFICHRAIEVGLILIHI
jgi:hypothetical protein